MPVGILSVCGAVFFGGLLGTVCGKYINDETKNVLMSVFGLAGDVFQPEVGNDILIENSIFYKSK